MKHKLKLISSNCNACGEPMIPDKYDYYTCSGCGAQFVPPEMESARAAHRVILDCARNDSISSGLMHLKSKTCGSKSSKGGSKKQLMSKPSTTQLYKSLSS